MTSESKRVLRCLSPLLCPSLGFIIGVVLSLFLPSGGWWGVGSKLLMVCYGLQGWAVAACFVQRRRLSCGGTDGIGDADWPRYSQRYSVGLAIVSAGFILSTIGLLGAGHEHGWLLVLGFVIFFSCLPVTFIVLVGEMGWEDPWKAVRAVGSWKQELPS
ncbi:MAG: hypothetical protein ABSH34_21125 [Verrucomicrobiota bacterium]|jgi:hypothetical protein